MIQRKTTIWLILILFLGLGIRGGYILVRQERINELVISDMRTYDLLARNLVEKNIYGFQEGRWPWRSYRPPLYPFFMSIIYRVSGYSYLTVRITQAFLAALSCLLLFYLARELAGPDVALISAFLFAIDFSLIHASGLFLSENLYIPLSLAAILLLIRGFRGGALSIFIGTGVAGGLATLCRPTILPFLMLSFLAPVMIVFSVRLRCRDRAFLTDRQKNDDDRSDQTAPIRRVMGGWMLMIFCAGLVILPWTARNYRIHRAFIPISTNTGTMLWMGLHPGANGGYDWPRENNPLLKVTDEVARNRLGISESVKFIFNHPREFLNLSFAKMKIFWGGYLFTWSGRQWTIIGVLGALGLLISLREWRKWLVLYVYLLSFIAIHLFVHSAARYRLPLHPLVEIWAAVFLVKICKTMQRQHHKPINSL